MISLDIAALINIYKVENNELTEQVIESFRRYFDIVLRGKGSGIIAEEDGVLVELKSLQVYPTRQKTIKQKTLENRWKHWQIPQKTEGTSYHRQVLLDALSTVNRVKGGEEDQDDRKGHNFQWFFHNWEAPKKGIDPKLDRGISFADGKAIIADGTQVLDYVTQWSSQLGANTKMSNLIKDNLKGQTNHTVVNGKLSLTDSTSGFLGRKRFHAFSIKEEAQTAFGEGFNEMIRSQLPEDFKNLLEKGSDYLNRYQKQKQSAEKTIEELEKAILYWLGQEAYHEKIKKLREQIETLQQGYQEMEENMAARLEEVLPKDFKPDSCY